LRCPHCGRELQATDVDADAFGLFLICRGCHKDVLTVGAAP
jgi:hypothetical protein